MAGLSVLLESKKGSGADARHVVSKFPVLSFRPPPPPPAAAAAAASFSSSFLEHCDLCRRRIPESEDIYMYRGDRAFCSEECRSHQIFMDEEIGVKKKTKGGGGGASCSAAAAAAPVAPAPPSRCRGRAAR